MLSYCSKFRKNTQNNDTEVVKRKSGRIMLLSKCSVCSSKKPKILKNKKLESY